MQKKPKKNQHGNISKVDSAVQFQSQHMIGL